MLVCYFVRTKCRELFKRLQKLQTLPSWARHRFEHYTLVFNKALGPASLLIKGLMHLLCFFVPLCTIGSYERILQKTKNRNVQRFSEAARGFADLPMVHIQGVVGLVGSHPDGVQMARQWLRPVHHAGAMGRLDSAERGSALKNHIGAFLASHQRSNPLAVAVAHVIALLGKRCQTLRAQKRLKGRPNSIEHQELFFAQGSARITLYAACAFALAQVAYKGMRKNFFRTKGATNRDHKRKSSRSAGNALPLHCG